MIAKSSKHAGATALLLVVTATFAQLADAKCTESRIRRLANQGETVAEIASTCEMSKSAVRSVIEDDDEPEDDVTTERPNGKRSGSPVGQCGCWGPVDPNYTQLQAECRSGYARPRMCNFPCMGGGFAWQGVCT